MVQNILPLFCQKKIFHLYFSHKTQWLQLRAPWDRLIYSDIFFLSKIYRDYYWLL